MNRISVYRQKRTPKITQVELAAICGWDKARIWNYENNVRTPNIKDCNKMIVGLNRLGIKCTLDDVFPPEPQKRVA